MKLHFLRALGALLLVIPGSVAEAGETEVKAAVVLIEDNQIRAQELGLKHIAVIRDTRIEMASGVSVRYEPGSREANFFAGEGGVLARRGLAQLEVVRQILSAELSSADTKVAAGATVAKRLADVHEAYLAKAIESAVLDMSFERMHKEMTAFQAEFETRQKLVPFWASTLVGRGDALVKYESDIEDAVARVELKVAPPGAAGQRGKTAANWMTSEEYQAKKKALADKAAADAQYREKRMAEIEQREKEKERQLARETAKAAAALPPPPPPPPDNSTVAAWHPRYVARIGPFKSSLGQVLGYPDRTRRNAELAEACSNLSVVIQGLRTERRLVSGTPAIDSSLQEMLTFFDSASKACMVGRMADFATDLAAGEAAIGRLAKALAPYYLAP